MKLDVLGLFAACSYALDCVEAELVHHRPDMGCRRIPRRGNAGGRGRVCVIPRRSCKENGIVKQNKAIAWNSVR